MDLDQHGYFWIPGEEDTRVRGHLAWSVSEGGELSLEGILASGGSLAASAPRLLGQTLSGVPMVLVDSFVRRAQIAAELTQRWHVNQAYVGTFDAEPDTDVLALDIDGLGAFTRTSGLGVEGTSGPRDPVHITWAPADPPLSLTLGDGTLEIVDERRLALDQDQFAVGHTEYLRLVLPRAEEWSSLAERLGLAATLIELLADRPMTVRRQWRPTADDPEAVEHFFQPVVGRPPNDPDKVWLTLADVEQNLDAALAGWTQLFEARRGLVDLIVEEVRFRRATSGVDRILRLTRILELLHRHQHPEATPEDDEEIEKVEAVLSSTPADLQGWLRDRMGVSLIRLRQRIRETVADLPGIEALLADVDAFAGTTTKTRNWHTHYGDPAGVADGESQRIWQSDSGLSSAARSSWPSAGVRPRRWRS